MSTFRKVTIVQRRNQRGGFNTTMTDAPHHTTDQSNRSKATKENPRRPSPQQSNSNQVNNCSFAEQQSQPSSSSTVSDNDQMNEQQPGNSQKP